MSFRAASYLDFIAMAKASLKRDLSQLPSEPYGELLGRLPGAVSGIYVILDDLGNVLYVGVSGSIRARLRQHISARSPLVKHLADERAISVGVEQQLQLLAEVAAKILASFRVIVFPYSLRKTQPFPARQLERLMQYLLQPALGYMHCLSNQHPYRRKMVSISKVDG